ncbi:MAG TPA: hypothetical protein VFS84_07300, partial [Candidatus Binatia bacterium]|nr:hypothetical protein [Candidatus Binatia bacterium]
RCVAPWMGKAENRRSLRWILSGETFADRFDIVRTTVKAPLRSGVRRKHSVVGKDIPPDATEMPN